MGIQLFVQMTQWPTKAYFNWLEEQMIYSKAKFYRNLLNNLKLSMRWGGVPLFCPIISLSAAFPVQRFCKPTDDDGEKWEM